MRHASASHVEQRGDIVVDDSNREAYRELVAGRFGHTALDRFFLRHSRRVVHPSRLRLVPKISNRPLHILVILGPRADLRQLLQDGRGATRLVFELMATLVHPRLARRWLAPIGYRRRFAQILCRMPKVHDFRIGVPLQELPIPLRSNGLVGTLIQAKCTRNRQRPVEDANRRRGDSSLESVYDVKGESATVAVGDICDG